MDAEYLPLLWETAGAKIFWQFGTDIRFFSMLAFGEYNMLLATVLAVIGGAIGSCANYACGWVVSGCQFNGLSTIPDDKYYLWQRRVTLWVPILGALSFIHLVGAVVFAAGFLRVSPKRMIPALALGQALYYGYYFLGFGA